MSQHKFFYVGGGLIIMGALLLLHRFGLLSMSGRDILWGLLALFGIVKLIGGFSNHAPGKAFWGAALLLSAAVGLLYPMSIHLLLQLSPVSILFLILGVSLIAAFLSRPREWHLIVPAMVFTGVGWVLAASDYGYFYWLDFADAAQTFLPLILVLFGISLLLNRRSA